MDKELFLVNFKGEIVENVNCEMTFYIIRLLKFFSTMYKLYANLFLVWRFKT